ncbi:MAG: hypothetical protein QM775_24405 [Pirellulales bacterium]
MARGRERSLGGGLDDLMRLDQVRSRELDIPSALVHRELREPDLEDRPQIGDAPSAELERTVADTLSEGRLLWRVSFTLNGRLVWTLFDAVDGVIRVRACDEGRGHPDALRLTQEALRQFDRRLDGIWDVFQYRATAGHKKQADRPREFCLAELHHRLCDESGGFRSAGDPFVQEGLPRSLRRLTALAGRVTTEFGRPETWSRQPPSQPRWESFWSDILGDYFPQIEVDDDLGRLRDQATVRLLDDLEPVFPLEALLGEVAADAEILVWADDALLAVPFPFLTRRDSQGNRCFLFESVGMLRTIVSPVLESWMRECDTGRSQPRNSMMASVSWLGANRESAADRAWQRRAEHRFRAAMAGLATGKDRPEWFEAFGAEGSHEFLARGLQDAGDRSVALLAVCGHGNQAPQGVILKDGIWDGYEVWQPEGHDQWSAATACDLANVDFLLQISCSIGRLRQSGLQDVTGFCANLFLRHARSVLAGRWPLHAAEAIDFARTVADKYLDRYAMLPEGRSPADDKSRGRAVAAARGKWVDKCRRNAPAGDVFVGLNTVAGMELYGLA